MEVDERAALVDAAGDDDDPVAWPAESPLLYGLSYNSPHNPPHNKRILDEEEERNLRRRRGRRRGRGRSRCGRGASPAPAAAPSGSARLATGGEVIFLQPALRLI